MPPEEKERKLFQFWKSFNTWLYVLITIDNECGLWIRVGKCNLRIFGLKIWGSYKK